MPARKEFKPPTPCRTTRRSSNGSPATGAARAAHKRSLEKFSQFCQTAVKLRHQAELGAHRSEWISYAAELRSIERSLQVDLRSVNLLVLRIQSHTQSGKNVECLRHDCQKAAKVGVEPELQGTDVKGVNCDPLEKGTNQEKKELLSPRLGGCLDPARFSTAVARGRSGGYKLPTTGGASRCAAISLNDEHEEHEETLADLKSSSRLSTLSTAELPVPVAQEETANGGVTVQRKAETLPSPLTAQHSGDDSAQLKHVLLLKYCANILAQSLPSLTDKKPSTEWPQLFKVFSAIDRYKRGVWRGESALSALGRHQLVARDTGNSSNAYRHSVAPCSKGDTSTFYVKLPGQPLKTRYGGARLTQCNRSISPYTRTKKLHFLQYIPEVHSPQRAAPAGNSCSSTNSCVACYRQSFPVATTDYHVEFLEQPSTCHSLPPKEHAGECELERVAQREKDVQGFSEPTPPMEVSEQAGIRTKQEEDLGGYAPQQRCQDMQRHAESALLHHKLVEQQNLPVKHQATCGRSKQLSHHITEFAVFWQMQHEILNHTHRQLQLEEECTEREVRRMRAHLHHLIRDRVIFPASLVHTRRSRTTGGKSLHKPDACVGGSASLSRLSTKSELPIEFQNQTHPDQDTFSSCDFTDEEEELLQELTEAQRQHTSRTSFAEGQRSTPGDCNAIVQLRGRYVSELEKLEDDLEKQLNEYNQQADDLYIKQQKLLRKVCVGTGFKTLQEHGKVLDRLNARGASRDSQEGLDLGRGTSIFSYTCAKESGPVLLRDESAFSCLAELVQNTESKRVSEEEGDKWKTTPSSLSTPTSPFPCMAHPCHQDTGATAASEPVGNAAPISSDCAASPTIPEETGGIQEVGSNRETTFSRSSPEDRNRAIAMFRCATKEFQHSKTRNLQQTGFPLLDKLKLIFPRASTETLRKLLNVDKQLSLLQQRRAATLCCFSRRREEATSATREQLRELAHRLEEEDRRKEQDVQQRKRTAVLQKRLEAQQRQAEEKQMALRNAAEARAAAQNTREVQRMKREEQRRAEDKRLIAEHREARAAACKRQELEAAAAVEQEAVERAARARRHRHLILRRREEDLWKSRMQAQAREYESLRQAQVIERLLKLAEKYAVDVPADPNRVQQPTCASQARAKQIRAERQEAQELQDQGHRLLQGRSFACFEVPHGYSAEELLSDMRLRVSTALHEAGLSQTRAGREALLEVGAQVTGLSEGAA